MKCLERASLNGLMEDTSKENSNQVLCMVMECTPGRMVVVTKDNTVLTRNTAKAHIPTLTAVSTKENGWMDFNMVKDASLMLTAHTRGRACGQTENLNNGSRLSD